jgi:hypothetical protein
MYKLFIPNIEVVEFLTPPSSWRVDILHSQLVNHRKKHFFPQGFGQDVGQLMSRMYMPYNNGTILNLVFNVMTIHLNMSCSLMKD